MRANKLLGALVVLAACVGGQARARSVIPPIYVFGEKDDDDNRRCMFTHATAISEAEARLRYNRIQIAGEDDYIKDKAIALYVNVLTLESTAGGICAASLEVTLKSFMQVTNPVTKKSRWADVHFCNRGTIFTKGVSNSNSSFSQRVGELVDECLTKYAQTDED